MKPVVHRIFGVLASLVVSAGMVFAIGSPAQATPAGVCYNIGNYSFKYNQHTANWFYTIQAWGVTNCPGGPVVSGRAWYHSAQGRWEIDAYDVTCDNYGFTVYTHAKSVASGGCGTSPGKYINFSELNGKPKHFWIHFRGTNSEAHNLP